MAAMGIAPGRAGGHWVDVSIERQVAAILGSGNVSRALGKYEVRSYESGSGSDPSTVDRLSARSLATAVRWDTFGRAPSRAQFLHLTGVALPGTPARKNEFAVEA